MNSSTAQRLTQLNRDFYEHFGESFAATRRRTQPGVKRMLASIGSHDAVLDIGCGTGGVARALADAGHKGRYLGIDYSQTMLRQAEMLALPFAARFLLAEIESLPDLVGPGSALGARLEEASFDAVLAFAVLHHVPDAAMRTRLVETVQRLVRQDGRFIHSNWQFLNSPKLAARIQPWEEAGISASEVDADDYLLDWRGGGRGLRYVHNFSPSELSQLAAATGFRIVDSFQSDGKGGQLSVYQVWTKAGQAASARPG